jgi:peroxiredoxin (alkyl hydroperoxide reductase subunit C)
MTVTYANTFIPLFTEVPFMTVRIGNPAPDFTAEAYHQGMIKTIHLADYRGKWVILFFYPADFTYV